MTFFLGFLNYTCSLTFYPFMICRIQQLQNQFFLQFLCGPYVFASPSSIGTLSNCTILSLPFSYFFRNSVQPIRVLYHHSSLPLIVHIYSASDSYTSSLLCFRIIAAYLITPIHLIVDNQKNTYNRLLFTLLYLYYFSF